MVENLQPKMIEVTEREDSSLILNSDFEGEHKKCFRLIYFITMRYYSWRELNKVKERENSTRPNATEEETKSFS